VHTQPFYQDKVGTGWGDFPKAEEYYQKCLSIPLYPTMSDSDVERVIDEVTNMVNPVKKW
jgi:dTDP-4-amino-4,6-dideoxygalactose transaminase